MAMLPRSSGSPSPTISSASPDCPAGRQAVRLWRGSPAAADFTAAFDSYAPEVLGYRTDLPYRTLSREVSQHWDWEAASEGEGGLGLALSSLEAVLLAHPQTRVMVANGRYDLVTPYLASRWLVDQLSIPPDVRAGIRLKTYEGGHMMYMRPRSRAALAADAALVFAAPGAPAP